MTKGKLLICEGLDGCGKTTQVNLITDYLKREGFDVVKVREPGGTSLGEVIRDLLLYSKAHQLTELMLFTASRMEIIHKVILPAIEEGKIVICDRFTDSTLAYQGYGRGMFNEAEMLVKLVHKIIKPDYTFYLDIPFETSIKRLLERPDVKNQFDNLDLDIKRKIYNGYKMQYDNLDKSKIIIDANPSIEKVFLNIKNWLDVNFIPQHKHLQKEHESVF